MLFTSVSFVFMFLPLVLLFYYVPFIKFRKVQHFLLFIVSLLFYAWAVPSYVLILLFSIFINYLFGILVDRFRNKKLTSKMILSAAIILNLGIIFFFKYLAFTISNINAVFNKNIPVPEIMLPIGISFFTFQAISYVIDVYRNNGKVQKNILNVGIYIAFFPQLVAGPIVRYESFSSQLENRKESFATFSDGVIRFIRGLAKKVLLANTLAAVADKAFSASQDELSVSFAWLGILAYSFQILFDFSGYSEMAIGLGKMFGFEFHENFNYPYISKSISEFFRRWHISLGSWFRDYVYFPLGGSRVKTKSRLIFNLFVVWILTGLWHGANWTFIMWGALYFLLISFEKITGFDKSKRFKLLHHIYTVLFVMIGWVLFRSADISQALYYLKIMFFQSGNEIFDQNTYIYFMENKFFFITAFLCSTPVFHTVSAKWNLSEKRWNGVLYPLLYILLFLISMSYVIKGSYNPFIYFNF